MKHSTKHKKNPVAAPRLPAPSASFSPGRWAMLGLALLLTAGLTWAFMELVVWNRLPSDLVGKWEVVQGPPEYREAVFEFHRNGAMVGYLNDNETLHKMFGDVRFEDDKLHITTRRKSTREAHVSVQTIRKLTDRELVVADERGREMRFKRMP